MSAEAYFDMDQEESIKLDAESGVVDEFLRRMIEESLAADVPVMAQIEWTGPGARPVLQFGVSPKDAVGFVAHIGEAESVISSGANSAEGQASYDYMGHSRSVPHSAEIEIDAVREAVSYFVKQHGRRYEGVRWLAVHD